MRISPKEARESKGVKLCHMAELLGITRATYRNKETGKTPWHYDEAETVSKELNIPIDEIDFSLPRKVIKNDQLERRTA